MSSEEAITKPNPDGQGAEDAAQGKPPRPSPSQEELAAMDPADARAILDAAKKAAAEDLVNEEEEEQGQQDDLEAAPLHLHTLREPALLRGTPGLASHRARSRSGSRSRTSSRDASPSPMTHASTASGTGGDAHHRRKSSGLGTPAESIPGSAAPTVAATTASSVSGTASDAGSDIDPDILLDRLGFDSDLEPPSPHEVAKGELALGSTWGHSSQPLPSLNESMCEDSLEDAGAFADLVSTLHTSLRAHALSEEIEALGILDEVGEEADDEGGSSSDEDEEVGGNGTGGESEGKFFMYDYLLHPFVQNRSPCPYINVTFAMPSTISYRTDVGQHPAVQVLDDLLAKVTDPAEKAKLLKLKREHSDKIQAAILGIADKERRSSMEGAGSGDGSGS